MMEEKEQNFIQRAIKIAQDEQIYLALAIGLFPLDYPQKPWQNKLIWINPEGKVVAQYLKLKPAEPLEPILPGKGGIAILDTSYGRIASVICADLDYPSLIRQAGRCNADLLLIPAQDWAAADPLHTHMAVFRAVENGTSMIKGTGGGLSIAVDPYGRTLNTLDYFKSTQAEMISCLSRQGVVTMYSKINDTFAWFCIGGFFIMSVWGYVSWRKEGYHVF